MQTIWIITQFTDQFTDNTSNRYSYIYNHFKRKGYKVKMITSSFSHTTKKRKIESSDSDIIFIKETGYKKNTSLMRLVSHVIYARNAYNYLEKHINKQDILICAIPSNYLAFLISKNLKGIKIFDIHDTWPESFIPLLSTKAKTLFSLPLRIWKKMRTDAVKKSDMLIAESREYLQIHTNLITANVARHAILLGTEISKYKTINCNDTFIDREYTNIVFAGNLGVNYDLDTILKAIELNATNLMKEKVRFYFFGNGEKQPDILKYMKGLSNLIFQIDRKEYDEYLSILKSFDIAINSFTAGTNVRYSYKSVDYLLLEIPILNNLPGEFWEDVEKFNLGLNYAAGDIDSFSKSLFKQLNIIKKSKIDYKSNISNYSMAYLDRETIYEPLFKFVNSNIKDSLDVSENGTNLEK